MAYLTNAKIATIRAEMREDAKDNVETVLTEVATAVAAHKAAVVAALAQNISATYVEAEVQAISDKVDAILTALKNAGLMATS